LEVKKGALVHEEPLVNIMVAMAAALYLVKVVVVMVGIMRLAVLELGMVVAVVVEPEIQQQQTMLVEMASKVLSELRCTTNENSYY
jgi:hypothetical protein